MHTKYGTRSQVLGAVLVILSVVILSSDSGSHKAAVCRIFGYRKIAETYIARTDEDEDPGMDRTKSVLFCFNHVRVLPPQMNKEPAISKESAFGRAAVSFYAVIQFRPAKAGRFKANIMEVQSLRSSRGVRRGLCPESPPSKGFIIHRNPLRNRCNN
jgi:hypothetical protein